MSALNTLVQPKARAAHIMVDGVGYNAAGIIREIGQKCYALPTLHCAIASIGPGAAGLIMAGEISWQFTSFDDLTDRIEAVMPELFLRHKGTLEACGHADTRFCFAGWSQRSDAPRIYMMMCTTRDDYWQTAAHDHNKFGDEHAFSHEPFKLVELDGFTAHPPPAEHPAKCGLSFAVSNPDDIPDAMNPELDLLHMLEMQRRHKMSFRPGMPEAYWVGGLALLTTITESGITQRVVHRWTEDEIGEPITPKPIDWRSWRADRLAKLKKPTPSLSLVPPTPIPSGLNRQQRRALERAQRS